MAIEVKYTRSISAELDAMLDAAKGKKIECFVLDGPDFEMLVKELNEKFVYDSLSNAPKVTYKNINIVKRH